MMTSRERWLAVLNRQKPDRIPTDYWATWEVTQRLMKDLKLEFWPLMQRLHIDLPERFDALHKTGHHPCDPQADIWGIRRRRIEHGSGGAYDEVAYSPLAQMTTVEQIHAFQWPRAEDHDYETFAKRIKAANPERLVICGYYEPFMMYCAMRGMEQAMMDLLVEPEIAEAALTHMFDYTYRLNQRMFEIGRGRIDLTYVAEDLGSQTGLLMGLAQIRRFLLPNQRKMADLARSYGIKVFYHTDGAARDVIPDLIKVTGIDLLNPIQWRCPGMEREGLVRDFGDKITFHGAIDNQQTLPFGTPEDVRKEVLDSLRIFAWPTRWICAPCHNIQPVSPTANIVAMYDTIWENGRL